LIVDFRLSIPELPIFDERFSINPVKVLPAFRKAYF